MCGAESTHAALWRWSSRALVESGIGRVGRWSDSGGAHGRSGQGQNRAFQTQRTCTRYKMEWGRQLTQEVYLLYLLYDIGGDNARQIFVYRICNRARYSYTCVRLLFTTGIGTVRQENIAVRYACQKKSTHRKGRNIAT